MGALALALVLFWTPITQGATGAEIAVLYPELNEPYRSIFAQMLQGLDEKARPRAKRRVTGDADPEELNAWLKANGSRVVVALGRQNADLALRLDRSFSIVVGGILAPPEGSRPVAGLSMTPHPAVLISRLKALVPGVRRVFAVYSPRASDWLIRDVAPLVKGVALEARPAADLRAATRAYQEILAIMEPGRDALWLPQDSVAADEAVVLPLVLKEAWDRSLIVISSNLAHAKRGALLAVAPDPVALGHELGELALAQPGASQGVAPARVLKSAANVRTASHLGFDPAKWASNVDFLFPEP